MSNIISKFPAKSIGKCSCVSKLRALILTRPEFDELFLTNSLTRPKFLFAFAVKGELIFFSSPQLRNPNNHRWSLVANRYHASLRPDGFFQISRPLRGWVSIEDRTTFSFCNPMTGKSFTLPELKTKMMHIKRFFAYDPIDKRFKVLCTTRSHKKLLIYAEHYVLTLGSRQNIWRNTESLVHLRPLLVSDGGICINGVLYYMAFLNCCDKDAVIACFDVRFEKLSSIIKPKDVGEIGSEARLINYNGQLGILESLGECRYYTRSFSLWVLKDTEKREWTKHIYKLRLSWWSFAKKLRIVGMIGTCEVVLSSTSYPFDLIYYNLEMNIIRTFEIRGFEMFKRSSLVVAHCFLDYVEDVKLL